MYNITFQQIETFLNVARHLNLSRAAEEMFISQPALSKTLQRFEEGVGMRLFYRSNQGVRLTPEGEYLFSTLEPLYTNIDKAICTASNISASPPRTLRIIEPSTYDAVEDFDEVKGFVRQFEELYPDVVIVESLGDFPELRRTLEFGEADLAIAQDFALPSMEGVSYKLVSDFRLYLAMSEDHPLAVYDTLDKDGMASALADEVFYRVPVLGEDDDRRITMERCHSIGFTPKRIEFVPNFETLLHKLRTKKGLSLCGKFVYAGRGPLIKYIPTAAYGMESKVVVAWRTNHCPLEARNLVDLIPGDALAL
ncbi:MAG: LysR family transcriptional regulator [Clostridiales Family XIII bacterium]|jgi:DNA-binding transcriptional LysR family regulator|nr:LysR family transcriptional regulator [Clostridiales Family XIII bacterium]